MLLLDLGLAGAGVYLLLEGLAVSEGATSTTKSGATEPAPAPVAAKPEPTVKAEAKPEPKPEAKSDPKPADAGSGSATTAAPTPPPNDVKPVAAPAARKPKPTVTPKKPPAQPIDPYQETPSPRGVPGPSLGPQPPSEPNSTGL